MEMLEELKIDVLLVLYANPKGVTFSGFPTAFRTLHGRELDLAQHGFTSARQMVAQMEEIVENRVVGGEERLTARGMGAAGGPDPRPDPPAAGQAPRRTAPRAGPSGPQKPALFPQPPRTWAPALGPGLLPSLPYVLPRASGTQLTPVRASRAKPHAGYGQWPTGPGRLTLQALGCPLTYKHPAPFPKYMQPILFLGDSLIPGWQERPGVAPLIQAQASRAQPAPVRPALLAPPGVSRQPWTVPSLVLECPPARLGEDRHRRDPQGPQKPAAGQEARKPEGVGGRGASRPPQVGPARPQRAEGERPLTYSQAVRARVGGQRPTAQDEGRTGPGAGPDRRSFLEQVASGEWPSPAQTRRPGRLPGDSGKPPDEGQERPEEVPETNAAPDETGAVTTGLDALTALPASGGKGGRDNAECSSWLLDVLRTKGYRDGLRSDKLATLCLKQRGEELSDLLRRAGYPTLQDLVRDLPEVEMVTSPGQKTLVIRLLPVSEEEPSGLPKGPVPTAGTSVTPGSAHSSEKGRQQLSGARGGAEAQNTFVMHEETPLVVNNTFDLCKTLTVDLLREYSLGLKGRNLCDRLRNRHGDDLLRVAQELGHGSIIGFLQQIPEIHVTNPQRPNNCIITLDPATDRGHPPEGVVAQPGDPLPSDPGGPRRPPEAETLGQLQEDVARLLSDCPGGLTFFQLTRAYGEQHRKPLALLGYASVKELLQAMGEQVTLVGLGVQTRIFPYSTAEASPAVVQDDTGFSLETVKWETPAGSGVTGSGVTGSGVTGPRVTGSGVTGYGETESEGTRTSVTESRVMESGVTESKVTESGVTGSGVTESRVTESGVTVSGVTMSGVTESGVAGPGSTGSGVTESGVTESRVTGSGVTESRVTGSGVTESGVTESRVTKSIVTGSGVTKSGVTGSSVTESRVTESRVTKSIVTGSSVTKSGVTESGVMGSGVTESGVTGSRVTESGVTESRVTESRVTGSGVTGSGVTESRVTESGVMGFRVTESGVTESGVMGSRVTESGVTESGVMGSRVTESGVTESRVTKSGVMVSGVTGSGVIVSGVTESRVTESRVTESGVTGSGVTESGVTGSRAMVSGVTESGVTESGVTESGVMGSRVTESRVTESGVMGSRVTESGVTESGVMGSRVTESGVTKSRVTKSGVMVSGVTSTGVMMSGVTESRVTESGVMESGVTGSGVMVSGVTEPGVTGSGVPGSGVTESGVTGFRVTRSGVMESGVTESGVTRSGVTESGVTRSRATKSGVTESEVTGSGVTESGVTGSRVTRSGVMEPGVTKPGVTESRVTESGVTRSGVTESGVTRSRVTKSGVTGSGVTESGATGFRVTRSGVTESRVTEPGVTESRVTESGVTEPTMGRDQLTPGDPHRPPPRDPWPTGSGPTPARWAEPGLRSHGDPIPGLPLQPSPASPGPGNIPSFPSPGLGLPLGVSGAYRTIQSLSGGPRGSAPAYYAPNLAEEQRTCSML